MSNNTLFLKNKFDLEVTVINKKLFNIYWTHKLHKSPTKERFMIAAPKCPPMKSLSKAVVVALKLISNQIEYYKFKTEHHSDVKTFLLFQNNQTQ